MYDWIGEELMRFPSATMEYKQEWEMQVYRIGGKIFAEIGTDKVGKSLLTLKLEPAFSELLRSQYPDWIVPGYYCNKVHWSSLYLDGNVPEDTVRAMLCNAYTIVRKALPKKVQAELD